MCDLVEIKSNTDKVVQVASIKSSTIQKLLTIIPLCDKIQTVYIFGSSLEKRCTEQSDIDIALISSMSLGKLIRDKGYREFKKQLYDIDDNQEYDLLYFKSLDELRSSNDFVCKDIINKGSIIYERLE